MGEGGFGRVYKGWVKENTFAAAKWGTGLGIAVKTLHGNSKQGYREWLVSFYYIHIKVFFPVNFYSLV